MVSLVVMAFTTIGYCGAHHHKSFLLIIYGFIILVFTVANIIVVAIYSENSIIGAMSHGYIILLAIIDLVLLLITFILAYKVSRHIEPTLPAKILHQLDQPMRASPLVNSVNVNCLNSNNRASNGKGQQRSIMVAVPRCPVPGCKYGSTNV